MSFFAVQVKSGQEIEAKAMMKVIFSKLRGIDVKAIYALESFTHVVKQEYKSIELSECLDDRDVTEYLQAKRVRENLSNLRAAYAEMPTDCCDEMAAMQKSYEEEINEQAENLKENKPSKRISAVMKGYILLELGEEVFELPQKVWQAVKSVPKVSNVVSPYSIPEEEVEQFFETIDLTPSVEISVEHDEPAKMLLSEESDAIITDEKNQECSDQPCDSVHKKPLNHWMEKCRLYISRKKKTILMPLPLFHYFLEDKEDSAYEAEYHSIFQLIVRSVRLEVSG